MRTETASMPTQATRSVIPIAAAAALGGFLFGYDTAIINGAGTAIQTVYHLGPTAKGFVISSALLGSVVGAWFAGQIGRHVAPSGHCRPMSLPTSLRAPAPAET